MFYGDNELTVQMEKGDATPPTFMVALTPSVTLENDRLVPIAATITVNDDYDPQPEIKLESISVSEVYEAGDIQDANLGTDDRQFLLKAENEGKLARIYTVTYSATDGSGNKALASATVTVQLDQSEKEHGEKDRSNRKEDEQKGGKSDKDTENHFEKKLFWKFW